jgi:hypothetical protein
MNQAPDPSKVHQLKTLLNAKLGIQALSDRSHLSPSELAALALRDSRPVLNQSIAKEVVFLLPLVRKKHVSNWKKVEENLARTLRSFCSQSNENWRAIVCGQNRPDYMDDSRIEFLRFDQEIDGNDKWAKLSYLISYVMSQTLPDSYIMTFDADDLAHPNLVSHFLKIQDKNGYLIDHGIIHDVSNKRFAQAASSSWMYWFCKPFWKLCGSSAAFRYRPEESVQMGDFLSLTTQHEHRMFPYLAKLANRKLQISTENLVMYELNHGENFGLRRNRGTFKERFTARFEITKPEFIEQICKDFHFDEGPL